MSAPAVTRALAPSERDVARLLAGDHSDPHAVLGAHPATRELGGRREAGLVVRAYHPDAVSAELLPDGGGALPMERLADGLHAAFVAGAGFPFRYRLRFRFANGDAWERDDPYRFPPTVGELDLHLFGEGTHRRLWRVLGAHPMTIDGVAGTRFAVWAPNARRVSVVGHFDRWDGRVYPMRSLGSSGVWELFVPGVGTGELYKYELLTREGVPRVKTDPYARMLEQPPGNASIVVPDDQYAWGDDDWMRHRAARPAEQLGHEPMAIYEAHLGSWARVPEDHNRSLSYREIAPRLAEHAKRLGFTHVELLPVSEHPFAGSWGYQVSGYYAPTSRFGTPHDFRFLVDTLHQHGLGVILDWVPAHFPKDDWALRRFDGTPLYEHADPRLGEHPDWGTLIFNFGRNEVRNFLIANALYWLQEFHVDGLRVDAVASMLYLDYSRQPGQWLRNRYGGRENLEAIDFLRTVNGVVRAEAPGCFTVAEESTAWPGVTAPPEEGGLGFTFKWNMGWMHDTLQYFQEDPLYRRYHQGKLTFAMVYEYSERFVMPLSHDEVVHLKKSLLEKMPGDDWQKFANLRALLTYQYTRPGKQLLFMGTELAQRGEWNHDTSLDWHLREREPHARFEHFLAELGRVYRDTPALWRRDHEPDGFKWIDMADESNSVLSYTRCDGDDHVVVVLNLTPVPHEDYRIGAPAAGTYVRLFDSDDPRFGGSTFETLARVETDPSPFHGYQQSMRLRLPPLGVLVLAPERGAPAPE
ncbi:MAG TPA: 1,4-alpha-glucan branching protein GlgB [Gemmatimonadaceae bacterium]|nr:1,4-alpha-glucan branching protein GlgB [Gemmatimonadaceae bacterium]